MAKHRPRKHRRHHRRISDIGRRAPRRRRGLRVGRSSKMETALMGAMVAAGVGFAYPVAIAAVSKLLKNRVMAGGALVIVGFVLSTMFRNPEIVQSIMAAFAADMNTYFDVSQKLGLSDYFADPAPAQYRLGAPAGRLPVLQLGDYFRDKPAAMRAVTLGDVARGSHHARTMRDAEQYGSTYGNG